MPSMESYSIARSAIRYRDSLPRGTTGYALKACAQLTGTYRNMASLG